MVVVQELINSLVILVNGVFTVLSWLLVIRIVLSWFGVNPYTTYNELLGALYQITDVLLKPFKRLPLTLGVLDLTPMVAFIALRFLQRMVVMGLYSLGGLLH